MNNSNQPHSYRDDPKNDNTDDRKALGSDPEKERDSIAAYDQDPMHEEKGYVADPDGGLDLPLRPGSTLDDYEDSTGDQDHADPEPS